MDLHEIKLLESENAETCFRLGVKFMENSQYAEAETCFRRTRSLAPSSLETILNLGYALDKQGRSEEALHCYESILTVDPDHAKARYNRAIHLLRAGKIAAGFADYEARFAAIKNADSRVYPQPRWDGSRLDGRSILVYGEQGLGDAIQFSRYLLLVAKLGGRVVLEVQPPLVSLLSTLPGVESVVVKSGLPPLTDCHIPLLSLPHLFGTTLDTVPVPSPYLVPDPAKTAVWRQMLAGDPQFRVGLVWHGSTTNPMDRDRSCPLAELAPLLAVSGVSFYSLQVGPASNEITTFSHPTGLIDLTEHLGNFSDTVALVANLDLVISVDTAVAHLVGAMGKPVWTMLAHTPDWRWMLERSDSPWYPTMRLFRQPQPGDWQPVVHEIVQALIQQLPERKQKQAISAEALETSFQQALAMIENNGPDTAIPELRTILRHLPDEPAVWFNLGRAYDLTGQVAEAEQAYRQALSNNPGSPAIWYALGDLKLRQKDYPEAESCLHKAHELKPESVEILLSLGGSLSAQLKTAEALDTCKRVLDIRPDCSEARYNMAFLQLRSGDYKSGFENFEARLAIEKFDVDYRSYQQPRWDGSPLNGRSILIFGEQGMGDVIQFARYIPLVAERGGRVVFEVDPPLLPLFDRFPGVMQLVPKSKTPPETDVYIQTLSLPYLFDTTYETVPNRIPYLVPDAAKVDRWRQKLAGDTGYRIGLVWRGNPLNPRDSLRSCSLATFAPLADLPWVTFYSLQIDTAPEEVAALPKHMQLVDSSHELKDFTETAALIANLDLVITVDTAVAHLAGAMGRPVWVILPEDLDWRWLQGRSDTPWYPSMRLFCLEHQDGWCVVLQRVKAALEQQLAEKAGRGRQVDIEQCYQQGAQLKEAGDLAGAESCFRMIVEQYPDLPDPQHSLGVVLQMQGRPREAVEHYKAAVALDPGFVQALYNLANALVQSGMSGEAIEFAQEVIRCDAEHADAHWLLGMLLLLHGDYREGWQEYEWRWQAKKFLAKIPDLGRPLWDGSPLAGKTLLIQMEQGRGDMIQFARFIPLAAAMGGRVVVRAVPELVSLLSTAEGVSQVVDQNGPLPDFDVYIPAMSLPHVLGITLESLPSHVPYLLPDPEKVEAFGHEMPADGLFRVGLVWQGASENRDNLNRSCALTDFQSLTDLEGVVFYNLQIGEGSDQLENQPGAMKIVDLTDRIHDFADTAALIENLDLVISVCTSVTHLAGALGKPVWTMLHFASDWRWLLERADSPWYPSMRLFRQTTAGDWTTVIASVRQELSEMLAHSHFHNQRGIAMLLKGDPAGAELVFSHAAALDQGFAEAYCNRGVALQALNRLDEALDCYQAALQRRPDFQQALFNMGNTCRSLDRPEQAQACYCRALELKPDFLQAHLALGEIAKELKEFAQAHAHFKQALSIDTSCAEAFQGLAETCQAEEMFEEAIGAYRMVLTLQPDRAEVWNLLGTVYHSLERLDEAEVCYRRALTLFPDRVTVLNNLGVVLNAQGRISDAIAVYRHLLAVDGSYAEGHWNLSVALLAAGEYREGWQEYEWRFLKANPVATRDFAQPRWDGSSLRGRTILLHAEQGFGDTIQFARYACLLAKSGGQVIIECQVPALKRLLYSLEGVSEVVIAGDPLPSFDCHLPLMSLPLMFGTTLETIPANTPYLAADPVDVEAWQRRLGPVASFRVGLVWFAKQSQVLNRKRSCRLELFAPLLAVPGVEFFSLQIGLGAEQLVECGADFSIKDLTGHITDFADTAGFIANLDLVITIDTAVAHLAGALGAKNWVILPHVAEWRWLLQREDSPWYPTMRLFRQPSQGDWPALMDNVAAALRDCVKDVGVKRDANIGSPKLRVGLAWAGRQDNPINCKRSCPFSSLGPLFELENIIFVKLQLDSTDGQNERMLDMTGLIRDFEDTAALMANLDLIISIDTSVAHLAAATGRPTWVLLAHVADWRWATGPENSAWYAGVELFRQPDFGDWDGVIREVTERLRQFSGKFRRMPKFTRPERPSPASPERAGLENLLEDMQNVVSHNDASADAHLNVGAALAILGRDTCAIKAFRHVLEIDPEHVSGHLNLAYSLLATGKYSEGWEHFEWRLKMLSPDMLPPWPMLNKETLGTHPHKTAVLVHCEQGYGDTILFSRFLSLLAETGYCVIVSCQPAMASLVASVSGVSSVIPHGKTLPTCDLQVLLLSLPYLFSVTRESLAVNIPYLVPGKAKVMNWKIKLKEKIQQHDFFSKEFSSFDDMRQ